MRELARGLDLRFGYAYTDAELTEFRELVVFGTGIFDFAIELGVVGSLEHTTGIHRQGLVYRQSSTKLVEFIPFCRLDQVIRVFQVFLRPIATKVIVVLKREP